jgi:hypothetical protein
MAADATLAFRAMLLPLPNVVTAATAPIIFARDTQNEKIARAGDSAPDVTGGIFAALSDPVVSPSGGLAFFGKLKPLIGNVATTTAAGLWQDLGNGVENAVRQGDPVAGIAGNVKFAAFKQFVLPATGGAVFTATIAGDAISSANNLGIWANDGAGANDALLRKGDKLTVNGKSRAVTSFKVFLGALGVTGQSRSFDASGAVACQVTFSDATQAVLVLRQP